MSDTTPPLTGCVEITQAQADHLKALEAAAAEAEKVAAEARKAVRDAMRAALPAPGTVVLARIGFGSKATITEARVARLDSVPTLRDTTPPALYVWLRVNVRKTDGTWSSVERTVYSGWSLIPAPAP